MRTPRELAAALPEVDRVLVANRPQAHALASALDGDRPVATPEEAIDAPPFDPIAVLTAAYQAIDAPASTLWRLLNARRRAWRREGSVTADLEDGLAASVATHLRELETPERALAAADSLEGSVAVVAPETFDALQRSVVPSTAHHVPVDSGETLADPTIETAPSRWAVAVRTVEAALEDEGTIVADPEGPYWSLLRSVVAARRPGRGDARWSAALELLDLASGDAPVRVADARTVLSAVGLDAPDEPDRRPLDALDDERATWVNAIAEHGRTQLAIGQILEQFASRGGGDHDRLHRLVRALDLADVPPTRAAVADLEFVTRLEASLDGTEGVLVGDLRSARRDGWPIFVVGGDWRGGPPVAADADVGPTGPGRIPLGHLLDPEGPFTLRLADGDAGCGSVPEGVTKRPIPRPSSASTGFEYTPEGRSRSIPDRLTKSRLNRLLRSPREALLASLLDMPAGSARTRGTGVHDYAELALADPAAVEAIGRERLIEAIVGEVADLAPERHRDLIETRIRAATAVIDAYLTDVDPPTAGIEGYDSRSWLVNDLAERFDVAVSSAVTEQYFVDDDLGVSGVVDLIRSSVHLVDFKTGAPPPHAAVVARGRPGGSDVQLPLYLAALRRRQPDRALRMSFVYCHGALGASLAGTPWVQALERSVPYRPQPSDEVHASPAAVASLCEAVPTDHPRHTVIDAIGAERVATALEGGTPTDTADLEARLENLVAEDAGDTATVRAGVRSIAAGIADRHRRTLYRDDLDRFERELQRWHRRRREYERDGYPLGDPPERHLDFPTMHVDLSPIVTGEGST